MIEIKYNVLNLKQKFEFLKKYNLLYIIECQTEEDLEEIYNEKVDKLFLKLKEFLPVIFNTDPSIKQLEKLLKQDLLYEIIEIKRPPIDQTESENIYYRLIVNK